MKSTLIFTICLALVWAPCYAMVVPSTSETAEPEVEVHGGGYSSGGEAVGYFMLSVVGGVACVSLGWYLIKVAYVWEEEDPEGSEEDWEDDETNAELFELGLSLMIIGFAMPFAALEGF